MYLVYKEEGPLARIVVGAIREKIVRKSRTVHNRYLKLFMITSTLDILSITVVSQILT
jgi:hypothetical protein